MYEQRITVESKSEWLKAGRMLAVVDPASRNRPSSLPDPAAGAVSAVGDGAPRFASQLDAATALHDRLDRDAVRLHAPEDTPPREAA